LSTTTAFCSDGVLELERSATVAALGPRASGAGAGGFAAAGWDCLTPAAAAAADGGGATDAVDVVGMSLASMPISCICLARFSA